MAEFCLKCLNKLMGTNDDESRYIISTDLDFCEGCGEFRHIVVAERKYHKTQFKFLKSFFKNELKKHR